MPALGRCPAGATSAAFPEDGYNGPLLGFWNLDSFVWPAVNIPATRLDSLGVDAVNVASVPIDTEPADGEAIATDEPFVPSDEFTLPATPTTMP